jgi:type IV pilus assembly protein PilP
MKYYAFILLLPFALIACGDEAGENANKSAAGKEGAKSSSPKVLKDRLKELEEMSREEAFIYRSDGVRDPFQPFIVTISEEEDSDRCALCVPLSSLNFTAVVTGIASPVALIETRDGVGHFARRGSELGASGGRVIDIREGVILLRERFQDQLGRVSVVDRSIRIRSQDPMSGSNKSEELIDSSSPRQENPQDGDREEERIKKTSGPADEL